MPVYWKSGTSRWAYPRRSDPSAHSGHPSRPCEGEDGHQRVRQGTALGIMTKEEIPALTLAQPVEGHIAQCETFDGHCQAADVRRATSSAGCTAEAAPN